MRTPKTEYSIQGNNYKQLKVNVFNCVVSAVIDGCPQSLPFMDYATAVRHFESIDIEPDTITSRFDTIVGLVRLGRYKEVGERFEAFTVAQQRQFRGMLTNDMLTGTEAIQLLRAIG